MGDIDEAVARLRARAEAHEGREWRWTGVGDHGYPQRVTALGVPYLIAETYDGPDHPHPMAEHIAGLDPATALAIADLLDLAATWLRTHPRAARRRPWVQRAEAVAAQYLRGEP